MQGMQLQGSAGCFVAILKCPTLQWTENLFRLLACLTSSLCAESLCAVRLRRQRLEDLKSGGGTSVAISIAAQLPSAAEEVVLDTAAIAVEAAGFAPRKRKADVAGLLAPDLDQEEEAEEEDEEDDEGEDVMLDWRAKRV